LAPPPLRGELAPAGRHEESVAILDEVAQRGAAFVDREYLQRRLVRFDERAVQFLQRQRVLEERRVDDGARDRHFAGRHQRAPPSLWRTAAEPWPGRPASANARAAPGRAAAVHTAIAHPIVRTASVPSVAHAAPSIDRAGIRRAFSARFTASAVADSAAYAP